MARHWTNSKGLGYDYDRSRRNQLERLRRELIGNYKKPYNKDNGYAKKGSRKVEDKQK